MPSALINQSITVINRSGKVVSTSKHLVSVWKEAKAAYQSKKAEIKASRHNGYHEKDARKAIQNLSLSDEQLPGRTEYTKDGIRRSRTTSRRKSIHPPLERGQTDPSPYANEVAYVHPYDAEHALPQQALARRRSDPARPNTAESYDEHLAYGDLPPPLPLRHNHDTEVELRGKMGKLNQLLDEANCLQYTATAMIEHLQKNPDALAAVALTLAEISTMVGKIAPSAFMGLKTAFPAVVALLASPEFLIAGGVAVGVTVVMLGGYKIIKRIKGEKEAPMLGRGGGEGDDVTELRELESDLSRVEVWRRGVADAGFDTATSVEGEFITPGAERRLLEEGVLDPRQIKPLRRAKSEHSHHHHHHRRRDSRDGTESLRSERTSGSKHSSRHRHHRSGTSRYDDEGTVRSGSSSKGTKPRKKSVGGLRMLFSRRRTNA